MGNHRFKLSDMMPNAWFYKLRDMSKPKNQIPKNRKLPPPPLPPAQKTPRKSYYHSTESRLVIHNHHSVSPINPKPFHTRLPTDPPRKSSKKRAKRKTIYMPSPKQKNPSSISGDSLFQDDRDDGNTPVYLQEPDSSLDQSGFDSSPNDGFSGPRSADIIINVDRVSYSGSINIDKFTEFNLVSDPDLELNLPPIVTKPAKNNPGSGPKKIKTGPGARKSVSRPSGVRVKIRANQGPKTTIRGAEQDNRGRRGGEKLSGLFYSESLAIVKASVDPERDFRDSMLEMIVENNIRASKDLEDLLACYLSLNSNQYHGLIIKAFEQIWFNMPAEPRF